MKLTGSNKIDTNQYELTAEVDGAAFDAAIQKVFRKKASNFNVPGFRKGKATRSMIERLYGAEIFYEDALNEMIPEVMDAAIDEAELDVVGFSYDDLEVKDVSADGFNVVAKVTVKPDVQIGEYKGLSVEKPAVEVTDDDLAEEIKKIQERNSRLVTVEGRAAQIDDIAVIDFEGFVDGVAFEGGKGEEHSLKLGSGQFIPGFEEQVVSHSTDEEFDVNVSFPDEYQAAELAGKDAVFKVKIKELKYRELPELDDEFAKDVSEFETLEEYKADVRAKLLEQKEKEAEDQKENNLIDMLIEGLDAEIPEVMFEKKMDDNVRDFGSRLESQGMNLDTYMQYTGSDKETFREGFRPQAERQVKVRLILEKIAETEALKATEEALEEEYAKIASAYNMEAEQIKNLIPASDLEKDIVVEQAINLVKESAVTK